MSDIGQWLEQHGLGRYAKAFAENDIDLEVLPRLSQDNLKELGLTLGHRLKIQTAIETLLANAASSTAESRPTAQEGTAPSEAERRQLTVMFADMVGSTALSRSLDPEDMREIIRRYQDACAGVIARYEGFVAKFMGDGLLAYFGYPRAHEDEAERAVRAGLALSQAVTRISTPAGEDLSARVGIATGLVVVGDVVGRGASQEQAVVGDTPNLAARLQAVAQPGQVVIAEATRRLLGDSFILEDLGEHDMKGLSEAVTIFAVQGEREVESRFEARAAAVLPMVGRDQELALLLERWSQVKSGEGQGVLLVGEAGIGKSRIVRGLLDALSSEQYLRIHYQCSPYHTDTALWPVIQQLSHAAFFDPDDNDDTRLEKLDALLTQANGTTEARALLADLVGLDASQRYGRLDLTPNARRARTLEALMNQLLGLSAQEPVLVIVEDAHWIDPTTLELIEQCLDAVIDAPALILLTSRPDNQPEIAAHPHVTRLTLNRLGRAGVETIVARLGGEELPRETIDAIIARTDGVPLFVEELTKAILETGEATIPASLHDSLMARLDRIPEVKEIAQIAACIGREFDFALLSAVVDQPETELLASLDRLTAAELVFRRGTSPARLYLFKHALVRDAAYESLLKRRRQVIHKRIVKALETSDGATPEILAYHAENAGLTDKAIDYWHRSGVRAISRPAYKEAIANFNSAIRLCRSLGENETWKRKELQLLVELGQALIANLGYQAPTTMTTFEQALQLADDLGETPLLLEAVYGLWASRYIATMPSAQLAARMLEIAEHGDDDGSRCVAMRMMALERFQEGKFRASLEFVDRALTIYHPARHRDLSLRFAHDPKTAAISYKAWNLWHLGFPDQARNSAEESLAWATEIQHANTIGFANCYSVQLTNIWLRDKRRVEKASRTALKLSQEKSMALWEAWSRLHLAWALGNEESQDAIAEMESALEAAQRIGARRLMAFHLSLLADLQSQSGMHERAARSFARAFSAFESCSDLGFSAELHRLHALALLRASKNTATEAAEELRRAIDIARKQEALSLELRAARDLARLWAENGNRQKAQDLLAPVFGHFEEGFTWPDMLEARDLLASLR